MSNFFLIHGTGGSPGEAWFPWLKKELERLGHTVYAPDFPTPEGQQLENWLSVFKPFEVFIDQDTVFVARSLGPAFVLRILERINIEVKAAFLVAGFCSDIGLEEFRPLIGSFIDEPFDWPKIRKSCSRFFLYNSDNDRYVPMENGRELAANLHAQMAVIEGADHFAFRRFPRILADIRKSVHH